MTGEPSADALLSAQRKLNLPLPDDATSDEFLDGVLMLDAALTRIRNDPQDTGGLDELRDYAASLHLKYGSQASTEPAGAGRHP